MNRIDDLGRYLYLLESRAHLLDDLLFPRQASSGENAGAPPKRGKSKPPLVVGIADVKLEVEECLGYWCGQVASVRPDIGHPPSGHDIGPRAEWLRGHCDLIDQMPFASMLCDEVIAQAMRVVDLVDPPASVDDPQPPEEGTTRQIARWTQHLGKPVSRTTIRRLIQSGKVASRIDDDGRCLVRLDDVVKHWRPAVMVDCYRMAHPLG